MISTEEIVERLIMHEGLNLKPYRCPMGYLTIGVGRNLITNPLTAAEKKVVGDWSKGITMETAEYLLRNDIRRVLADCRNNIKCWNMLDAERKYALLDMAFNLGIKGLLRFKKNALRFRNRQLSRRRQRVLKLKIRARCRQAGGAYCQNH